MREPIRYQVPPYSAVVVARFWAKVEMTDGCWLWVACLFTNGYPAFRVGGRQRKASQVSWELKTGKPFPRGKVAMHDCDNPLCVRAGPGHVRPATGLENNRDMWRKGRGRPTSGSKHYKAKLTVAVVLEARKRRANGERLDALAKEYGVVSSTLCLAIKGRTWKSV